MHSHNNSYPFPIHTDIALGETQQLSQILSNWSEKTSPGGMQFVVRPKSTKSPESEDSKTGLVRVYHRLYGDYESYLSYIVTPLTDASQLLQQAVMQLSPSGDHQDYQLLLRDGARGEQ